jgi:alkylation response protein AidB-like acyl-CoA dehydrogenase
MKVQHDPIAEVELAWKRVRAVKPVVLQHREEGDTLRRLPDAIAEAFVTQDLYRLPVPRDFGGLELDPLTLFDLAVEVSSYDGSTGWNFVIGISGPSLWGLLPVERIREIFGVADCAMAGSGVPPGRAVAVEGGYRVTGRWSWASGIHQAKWVSGSVLVYDGETMRLGADGKPVGLYVLLSKDQAIVHDVWFTGGLRGTGSTDWEAKDVFVPEHDACRVFTGESVHPAPIFRFPGTYFGMGLCGVGLGIAKSALDELKSIAKRPGSSLASQSQVQYAVAKAQALIGSSHLNVRESFRVIWDNVRASRPHTLEQRGRVRGAYVHAVESAVEAVNLCVEAAGGAAVFETHVFQRAIRDVHAVHGHIVLSRRFMEAAGQAAFGQQPSDARF